MLFKNRLISSPQNAGQSIVDNWSTTSSNHTGICCFGKTSMETFIDSVARIKDKKLNWKLQTESAVSG
ncbi:MAG: hypothetical protein DRP45_02795 [Candidatus Zixiibacteriota bacterium]|nr:MAG: hypothetical protein DRP45_02795 [candidate division Zixibacteria bacterium]